MKQHKDKTQETSDRRIHAYDHLLQHAEHTLGSATAYSEVALKHALDAAREKTIELGELTDEEADKVHELVTHDLYDAVRHLVMEKREFADWLRLGLLLVEQGLLNRFATLAQAAKPGVSARENQFCFSVLVTSILNPSVIPLASHMQQMAILRQLVAAQGKTQEKYSRCPLCFPKTRLTQYHAANLSY